MWASVGGSFKRCCRSHQWRFAWIWVTFCFCFVGRWQDRRIVVTGSVPPFDAEYADQIAAQPQIDEGDFLTAVVSVPVRTLCLHFHFFVCLFCGSPYSLLIQHAHDAHTRRTGGFQLRRLWRIQRRCGAHQVLPTVCELHITLRDPTKSWLAAPVPSCASTLHTCQNTGLQ